jgi:hypothetical protein
VEEEDIIKPSSSSLVSSSVPHTSSAAVTLRSQPDVIGNNVAGDRRGRFIKNLDLIKSAESVDKKERVSDDLPSVRARVTGSGALHKQHSEEAEQPPSSDHSLPKRSRPPPPDTLIPPSSSSSHSKSNKGGEDGVDAVVTMRQRKYTPSLGATGKRLSKEEIEAALERADNYLSNLSSAEAEEDKSVKRRSWDVRKQRESTENSKRHSLDENRSSGDGLPAVSPRTSAVGSVDVVDSTALPTAAGDASSVITLERVEAPDVGASSDFVSLEDIPPPSYESTFRHRSSKVSPEEKPRPHSKPSPPANKPSVVPRRVAPPPPLPSKPPVGFEDDVEEMVSAHVQARVESSAPDWGDTDTTSFTSPTPQDLVRQRIQ